MPFLITDSALIASLTCLVTGMATGALGVTMAQRGARQVHRAEHGHWHRDALREQTARVGALTRDAGWTLVKTGVAILVWAAVAFVVPYDRVGVLPIVTLAPAVLVVIVTGRLAQRFRAALPPRRR